ncbi:hypothetical protein KUTeg_004822 [Tegillarca granosa]|uniref:Transforming acidic coiled-coil-containing protein C-terminal domain-containing protein n=1 Tax=Tegillarca granosa TaxID=220873 RepID=A0ABQ9FMI3_TEGGR|nr:hypothetical protein KUTeg_004822 [Tegillarca granosa]
MTEPAEGEPSSPIPIPRGSYNINFDEIDENTNPFVGKSKIQNSPTGEGSPFASKVGLKHSPPIANNNTLDNNQLLNEEDASNPNPESTTNSEEIQSPNIANTKLKNKIPRTPPNVSPGDEILEENNATDETKEKKDSNSRDGSEKPPASKTTPKKTGKKGLKKPKFSKFKPPENFGVTGGGEDIQIFVPEKPVTTSEPEQPTANNKQNQQVDESPAQPMVTSTDSNIASANQNDLLSERKSCDIESTSHMEGSLEMANQMERSLEMMHEFGAGEMPEEENEGFAPVSDAFADSAAWDMLENLGHEGHEDIARESLYEKFDPLHQPDENITDSVNFKQADTDISNQSEDLLLMNTPHSSKPTSTRTVPKHPAARALDEHVQGDGSPRERSTDVDKMFAVTPTKIDTNKSDDGVVDGKCKMDNQDAVVQLVQVLKYSQTDWNKLKQELELDFQAKLLNKEREWSKKLADREKTISSLEDNLKFHKQSNEDMRCVVAEFEKTIAQLQDCNKSAKTGKQFCWSNVLGHQSFQSYQANMEIEKVRKTTSAEVARLEAAARKAELQVQSLQKTVEQKTKENQELTSICDELIAKVGVD